jgi:uncharacterized protein YbjT (DUF2867 family)
MAKTPVAEPLRVLLTGATGFVGHAVYPALRRAGYDVRCMTRDATRAARHDPQRAWVSGDVDDEASIERALDGCDMAFYLVHGMAASGGSLRAHEVAQGERFARAAARVGVRRVVYLGGVAPADGHGSAHLQSRLAVGEALRAGAVPTIELRASMIIGRGSLSWVIVRDLAARLPVMVLPRWLTSRTEPVAIDDVVAALVGALTVPLTASAWFDVPGPEALSGREILDRTATILGLHHPRMLEVPFLTPRLSSWWVRLVTRAEWSVAREVVVGLTDDLLARDDRYWALIGQGPRIGFDEAARRAVREEQRDGPMTGPWGAVERTLQRVARAP